MRIDPALKTLARTLIERAGGIDAVAAATRVGRSQLSNYQSLQHEQHVPADVVARLEDLTGEPLITAELARRGGHLLVRSEPLTEGELDVLLARFGAETGPMFAAYADARRDGVVTREEKQRIHREVHDALRALHALEGHLAAELAGEGGAAPDAGSANGGTKIRAVA
jgi:hypothetical protein